MKKILTAAAALYAIGSDLSKRTHGAALLTRTL